MSADSVCVDYPWLEPTVHKRNGRYRVTPAGDIELVAFRDGVEVRATGTERHPELGAMVHRCSRQDRSTWFSINEWRHVLLKKDGRTLYAGRYDTPLRFQLDGETIFTEAPRGLRPGQPWAGPRTGMKYTLTATGKDVYGKQRTPDGAERKIFLSSYLIGCDLHVSEWGRHKSRGGAVYINESRELFGPGDDDDYVYLGYVPLDTWFPRPAVEDD
ncbi:hypothetical protein [Blastococcus atacamensis]|uniref:hypothetical protein n=1 Tax=Blastococcus atacamensis TaxID=2070508 RepID=UPI000CEBBEB6|nr:hypothetical protein [Blastococcus atacamensis]